MIVTGEASGDLLAANLIRASRQINPSLSFFGVGGSRMQAEGCELLFAGEELAVMGLVEVLWHFPAIYKAFCSLRDLLRGPDRPDLLILIDFPDFNLRLARHAKAAGIPVLYYVSPQVWAWRRGRVKKIARVVDRLAAVFPFEPELYRGQDIQVEYVGHPLVADVKTTVEPQAYKVQHGLDPDRPVIGLFPGSRRSELKYIFATILDTARLLNQSRPEVQFLLPVAPSLDLSFFETEVSEAKLPIHLVQDNIYDTAQACDAVVSVSGTVTLQIALVGTPLAIIYKMNPLTFAIGKRLIKVPFIGLVNIVAGRRVVKEFIQNQASPEAIAGEMLHLIDDAEYASQMRAGLSEVKHKMGGPGCSENVARIASAMLSRD